jgi:hypothetical protein
MARYVAMPLARVMAGPCRGPATDPMSALHNVHIPHGCPCMSTGGKKKWAYPARIQYSYRRPLENRRRAFSPEALTAGSVVGTAGAHLSGARLCERPAQKDRHPVITAVLCGR